MSSDHVGFETLVAWWLGELAAADEAPLEEHLFACGHCAERVEWLGALSHGVRTSVRAGAFGLFVSAAFVEVMKRSGMRVREYRVDPGGSVNCTIGADDDAVLAYLRAPLSVANRVDGVKSVSVSGAGETEVRLEDVPFDRRSGEVVFMPSASWLRTMPALTGRIRLFVPGDAEETPLAEFTFLHSPSV
jgi:anti-sigma factor RsiW